MQRKNVLITGATSGIGRATTLELAKMNANIIFVARNENKAKDLLTEIKSLNMAIRAEYLIADLSSLNETRNLALAVMKKYKQLDVLINNAGLIIGQRKITIDNFEYTFALDHLSPFLLTGMLLELLQKSTSARIINVSSAAHVIGRIHFDDLMLTEGYSSFKAYGQAKLANILFTYELSRRLKDKNITTNTLHPGTVATNFGSDLTGFSGFMMKFIRPLLIGAEKGAQTSVYLASSNEVEGISGKYFIKKKPVKSSPLSYNKEIAQRLWVESEKLTGFQYSV